MTIMSVKLTSWEPFTRNDNVRFFTFFFFFKSEKKFNYSESELKKILKQNKLLLRVHFFNLLFDKNSNLVNSAAENTFNLDYFILTLLNLISFIFIPSFEILLALSKPLWLIVILLSCVFVVKLMFLCFESNTTNGIENHTFKRRKSIYDLDKNVNLGTHTEIEL